MGSESNRLDAKKLLQKRDIFSLTLMNKYICINRILNKCLTHQKIHRTSGNIMVARGDLLYPIQILEKFPELKREKLDYWASQGYLL